uniref:Uncharacterized protein n=1 Tax=Trichinella nativa TaxID=6335 RepID=A0A0V1KHG9_9BILA
MLDAVYIFLLLELELHLYASLLLDFSFYYPL